MTTLHQFYESQALHMEDIITPQEYSTYADHVIDASFSAAQAIAGMEGITTLGGILDSEMPIHTTYINLTQQDL